ncbi:MAG: RagB/SusD family nutrient uptake outer membrane protein [Chitinophagaceae bacterium]|nr:RagB/SusD family nutrient uptake outer membrane protein [Chitinophagaceae bacterium]
MKNKIALYIFAAATVLGTACEKKLDLINPQSLDAQIVYSTDDRIKKVLIGTYAEAGAASLFGGDAWWMSDLLGSDGELTWVGTFPDPRQIILKNIQVNNANVFATYAAAYRVIYYSNNILANLETVKAVDRARVEGEAKFLRAMAYFELIKFFGEKPYGSGNTNTLKGVPMPLTAAQSSPDIKLPRSTVEQVYNQIITDFNDAETKLPATRNSVYANKPAAALGLARVYLQQGKYAEARDAANRCIIASGPAGISLVPVFEDERV